MPYRPSSSNPVAMPILNVHTVILIFGKMRLSLSPLTGQQYILLKNPDQYLEEEEEEEDLFWNLDRSFFNEYVPKYAWNTWKGVCSI